MKAKRMYIVTTKVRGTQTILVDGTSCQDAIQRWKDGFGERVDLSQDWAGAAKAVVDGGRAQRAKRRTTESSKEAK